MALSATLPGPLRRLYRRIRGAKPKGRAAISLADLEVRVQRDIQDELQSLSKWVPDVRVDASGNDGLAPFDVRLSREGDGFVVHVPGSMGRGLVKGPLFRRAAAYLQQFRHAPSAKHMVVTVTDGHLPGTYRFSPSTASPNVIPIPDPFFFRDYGYLRADEVFATSPDWADRDDALVWRGAPNGMGFLATDAAMARTQGVMHRCRLVLTCKGTEIDAGFVIPPRNNMMGYAPLLGAKGMMAQSKDRFSWGQHRYALDIDGYSNAWDNFAVRLKLGCCVLKVDSEAGFRQWYYDRLTPWEHFVPVKWDLSDLFENYDWLRANPNRAGEIAAAGRAVAAEMTLERETAAGARLIEEHWNG